MTANVTFPRRGIADRTWVYTPAVATDIAATFAAERARLAELALAPDAYAERSAVRAAITELCDAYDMPLDVALPMPAAARWDFTVRQPGPHRQAGRIHTDDAVALFAVACLAAACRFGGLFG